MTERECTYLISRMETVGPAAFDRLLAYFGTAQEAWRQENPPLSDRQRAEWRSFHERERENHFRKELQDLPKRGCRFLTRDDREFPESLRPLYDCPVGLFVKGRELPGPGVPCVSIVGARRCTQYGKDAAQYFGRELAKRGAAVISGMAMGIDSCGQWGALQGGGLSVAVLGSGIDVCYPSSNRKLYGRLSAEGVILSEYGPGEQALPFHFPIRNRLISGLSQVILVIEAREKSGSLITVDRALEQGKDVLALPGRMGDALSEGCHNLIRQGAGIAASVEDVLHALGMNPEETDAKFCAEAPQLTERQEAVYRLLSSEPVHQDVLAEQLDLSIAEVLKTLWELEKVGVCRQCTGGTYMRQT